MKHCVLNAQRGKHLAAVNLMGSEERSPEKVAKGGEPGDTRKCFLAGASNHRISCSCFTSWHNKEQRKKEQGTRIGQPHGQWARLPVHGRRRASANRRTALIGSVIFLWPTGSVSEVGIRKREQELLEHRTSKPGPVDRRHRIIEVWRWPWKG